MQPGHLGTASALAFSPDGKKLVTAPWYDVGWDKDYPEYDVKVLDILPIEACAFYVMDRGYVDFYRLFKMHQAGAFFVTRAKRGMNARRVYSSKTDRTTGVICDQAIRLKGFYISKDYPEHLRRIRYKDPETGKTFVFLTNNTTLPPLTIAALYKSR